MCLDDIASKLSLLNFCVEAIVGHSLSDENQSTLYKAITQYSFAVWKGSSNILILRREAFLFLSSKLINTCRIQCWKYNSRLTKISENADIST